MSDSTSPSSSSIILKGHEHVSGMSFVTYLALIIKVSSREFCIRALRFLYHPPSDNIRVDIRPHTSSRLEKSHFDL